MAITEADVRLMQSQRLTDFPDGGGRMTFTAIEDGVENNLFPDVGSLNRIFGRLQLRKCFAAVLSEDDDTYIGGHVVVEDIPDDPAVEACVVAYGGLTTERAEVAGVLSSWHAVPVDYAPNLIIAAQGSNSIRWNLPGSGATTYPAVGEVVAIYPTGGAIDVDQWDRAVVTAVGPQQSYGYANEFSVVITVYYRTVLLDRRLQGTYPPNATEPQLNAYALRGFSHPIDEPRPYGAATTTALAEEDDTTVTVDTLDVAIVPMVSGGTYPTYGDPDVLGIDPYPLAYCDGRRPFLRENDAVLVHHTASLAPATVSNGQTVNVSRINLARLRVIGSTGVVHATFTENATPPSGVGCTADLAAGTVTFSDVSGMAQPVTVEHRVETAGVITDITGLVLTLTVPLAHDYPSGSRVSSILVLGDMQSRAEDGFAQQTWTNVWSDTRIGADIAADFAHSVFPIVTTNKGAVTERWAVIFTSSAAFRIVGEFLGEIGTGGTGLDCSPNNPATSEPYFTIPATGWGSGWASGNVYRFNTVGAQAPLWALRCVAPSEPFGTDSVTLQLRGDVDA